MSYTYLAAEHFLLQNEVARKYIYHVGTSNWFHVKGTPYYCQLKLNQIGWYNSDNYSAPNLGEIFDRLPIELQHEMLFYLELFR